MFKAAYGPERDKELEFACWATKVWYLNGQCPGRMLSHFTVLLLCEAGYTRLQTQCIRTDCMTLVGTSSSAHYLSVQHRTLILAHERQKARPTNVRAFVA